VNSKWALRHPWIGLPVKRGLRRAVLFLQSGRHPLD
jgi:hypothetical protein